MISEPGFAGLGNGCLQDILFNARIHPRRRVASLQPDEERALYDAMRDTLQRMVDGGGRDIERDLYGKPGGYLCQLNGRSNGTPCRRCGTHIEKIQYLGGASYFCPQCQR
jgi:formamidopyrimidine-DNA glycosylase